MLETTPDWESKVQLCSPLRRRGCSVLSGRGGRQARRWWDGGGTHVLDAVEAVGRQCDAGGDSGGGKFGRRWDASGTQFGRRRGAALVRRQKESGWTSIRGAILRHRRNMGTPQRRCMHWGRSTHETGHEAKETPATRQGVSGPAARPTSPSRRIHPIVLRAQGRGTARHRPSRLPGRTPCRPPHPTPQRNAPPAAC